MTIPTTMGGAVPPFTGDPNMKHLALPLRCLLLVVAFAANIAAAQDALLWEARSGAKTVYLYGTIHVGRADMYPLPPSVEQAYRSSHAVALEADITDQKAIASAMQIGMLPQGRTLSGELPPELAEKLQRTLSSSGIPPEALRSFKPFMAMLTLVSVEYSKLGYVPQLGLDRHFAERAKADAKRIIGLESMEGQIRMMDSLSKPLQQAMLQMTLDDIANGKVAPMATRLVSAWRQGDTKSVHDLMMSESKRLPPSQYAEYQDRFLDSRNRDMLTGVAKAMKEVDTLFVAVGAMHLIGPGSLTELVEKAGYSLKRVPGASK
jgi:uncharacterized protein